MGKTIEEASQEYACSIQPDRLGRGDLESAFEAGVDYIMELPLRDRLTDEEKEKITAIYAEASEWLKETEKFENRNDMLRVVAVALHDRLESIFGAEMFD